MHASRLGRWLVPWAALLAGCGGTKVLKDAVPVQTTRALASAADPMLTASLDWVVVRDGPGTWAKNADWDEYLLRIVSQSDRPVQITSLSVVDSLDTRIASEPSRKRLVRGSKQTARRYRDSGIKVRAGRGAGTLLAAGAAVTAFGVASAYAAGTAAVLGGATTLGTAGTAIGALGLLGPALAVGGIVRGVNNGAVNRQIETRQSRLPIELAANETVALDVFFPLAPSPQRLELAYLDETGEHLLVVDTRTAMQGLHLDVPAAPVPGGGTRKAAPAP